MKSKMKGKSGGHKSYGSPASLGASKGMGSMAGAGQLPAVGPGKMGMRIQSRGENPTYPTPSGSTPKGMKTYSEE